MKLPRCAMILAMACSGDAGHATAPDAGHAYEAEAEAEAEAEGATNPVGAVLSVTIEPFNVRAGTERQVCKTVNLPSETDVDVVRFHSTMVEASHHFNIYKVLGRTDAVTGRDAEVHDCDPASEQLSGDAAYIFGSATPERVLDTPEGVAWRLPAGQQLILEQHVIGAGAADVQGGATLELGVAGDGAAIAHRADIAWLGNWLFYLPPGQQMSATAHCALPYDVEVFGLMSHTHRLGTHFSIERWTPSGTTHLYDSTDWSHPRFELYAPTVHVAAGEGLAWTCTWDNTTDHDVGPGRDSTDEMCIAFAAVYPSDSSDARPYQCNPPGL